MILHHTIIYHINITLIYNYHSVIKLNKFTIKYKLNIKG